MGEKNTKSVNNLSTYIIISVIVFSIIGFFVYQNNKSEGIAASLQEESEKLVEQEIEEVEPTAAETETIATPMADRLVQVFIDTNKNKVKDSGEESCDVCIAKVLVGAQASLYGALPGTSGLKQITMSGGGKVEAKDLVGINQAWGFFADRQVLIPNVLVLANDGASELQIPAWETSVTIAGVNANVTSTLNKGKTENGFEIIYIFESLLPSLSNAANKGQDMWVVLTPDLTNPGNTYITPATIKSDTGGQYSGSPSGYYIKVNWPILEEFDTATEAENISFVLL